MKRLAAFFFLAVTAILCAVSCWDDDSPIATGTFICNVTNPVRLISDNGEYMNITENITGSIPDSLKRVMINCDVLSQHKDDEKEYDIRLLEYAPVTIGEPVLASETDSDELGDDALNITAWNSGGYFNAFVSYTSLSGSSTRHSINLVLDDEKSDNETLYLRFTHNAYGESFDNPDVDVSKIIESGRYFSFNIEKFIPSGQESITLHIEYVSYITSDNIILREKENKSGNLKYNR